MPAQASHKAGGSRSAKLATLLFVLTGYRFVAGVEHEFYIDGSIGLDRLCRSIRAWETFGAERTWDIVPETGVGQFELRSTPTWDLDRLLLGHRRMRTAITDAVRGAGSAPDWRAVRGGSGPSSGLHINLSLHDSIVGNLFAVPLGAGMADNAVVKRCLAGLLHTLPSLMLAFAPSIGCYERFRRASLELGPCQAPVNVSWGMDNRTTALRIPPTGGDVDRARIEHRVSSAAADLDIALSAVLLGVLEGVVGGAPRCPVRTYGIATDSRLDLRPLSRSRSCALRLFRSEGKLIVARWRDRFAAYSHSF